MIELTQAKEIYMTGYKDDYYLDILLNSLNDAWRIGLEFIPTGFSINIERKEND